MQVLSEHPSESVPQASQQASKSQSIYRFWSNERIRARQIVESHRPSVVNRVNAQTLALAVQDTTDLDFTSLKQATGLGFICQTQQQGIKVHSCECGQWRWRTVGLVASIHLESSGTLWQTSAAP